MKKNSLLSLTVCLCTVLPAAAQYHPMLGDTSQWCLAWNITMVRESRVFEYDNIVSAGDITIGSHIYKQVHTNGWSGSATFGALREDDTAQKVYYVPEGETTEELLYDFSLAMGDSIYVNHRNNFSGNLNDGYYYVDSVGTVTIRGGARKYLRLVNPLNINPGPSSGEPFKLEWIESVGEIHNPLYNMMYDMFGYSGLSNCINDFESAVLKNEINHVKNHVNICAAQYVNGSVNADTCAVSYYGNVQDIANGKPAIAIYPNPSNGRRLTVDLQHNPGLSKAQIVITDITGKTMYSHEASIVAGQINLTELNLATGTYSLMLRSKNATVAQARFVITR